MNDMSDVASKLSEILKEKNIDINDVLNNINSSSSSTENKNNVDNSEQSNSTENNVFGDLDFDTLIKFKTVIDKINASGNLARNNLLMSLKPYLRESRKEKLDQCIKLANISSVLDLFKTGDGYK